MNVDLRVGDCREVLKELPDNSIDSIVTDPPYELGFMGKKWDSSGIAYDPIVWAECLRVLKPGGHLLAFGGTRTYHRMACAIEDVGFEIRDCIQWLYGSGFPKSLDISKELDKRAGVDREVIGVSKRHGGGDSKIFVGDYNPPITAPTTPEAKQWAGWGTALKPANEPIVVARKPLVGTVAENIQQWGVGGLNIDASRIPTTDDLSGGSYGGSFGAGRDENGNLPKAIGSGDKGRWPANIILDEEAAQILDEQSGERKSGGGNKGGRNETAFFGSGSQYNAFYEASTGGASRFFYVAKASKAEREAGLDGMKTYTASERTGRAEGSAGLVMEGGKANPYAGNTSESHRANHHPTVKPIALMRYLVRMVTPRGGVVLDPFMGSGSTGCAAVAEGFNFIGVDNHPEYVIIAKERIQYWSPLDV